MGRGFETLGIRATDVRRVVMSHLHTDHAGGLHHFPNTEILASRGGDQLRKRAAGAPARLPPNNRWPAWFDPTPLEARVRAVRTVPRRACA